MWLPSYPVLARCNKEARWLYAELKSHISFQVTFVAYLKLSNETWNEMCYLKLFETWNFWNLKLLKLIMGGGLLIWIFQMRIVMRCAIWNFLKLGTFQSITGVAYLKLSDETWNKMCYLKCLKYLKLETFQTYHGSYLLETFRWDLKKDVIFETFGTFKIVFVFWASFWQLWYT